MGLPYDLGYWGLPPQAGPYRTGDLVRVLEGGDYAYLGRRDNMVKVRGHRVEPGEIEAALVAHPRAREAAVVIVGSGLEARIVAFIVTEGGGPSLIELKRHCSTRLPRHMILDDVVYLPGLPRTRNGKIDRLELGLLCSNQR